MSSTARIRKITSFSLDPDIFERLQKLADAEGINRSQLLEELISDGLNQRELGVKLMTNPVIMPALATTFSRPEVLRAMLEAMKEELSDQQLHLFQQAMHGAAANAIGAVPAGKDAAKRVQRPAIQRPPLTRKKRRKH